MKIIDHVTAADTMGNNLAYTVIELTETELIGGDPLENTHRYWVPAGSDIHDSETYLEPLDNVDTNFISDYRLYRETYGFLFPAEIKAAREQLGLTLRETALILAMSFATLSNIENSLLLQSFDQEIKLRLLTQPNDLRHLIRQHRPLIRSRAPKNDVNADKLFSKLNLAID